MSSATDSAMATGMAGLRDGGPRDLGHTEWAEITPDEVNQFADLTGDHNVLHVDPERARATPFGGTIAVRSPAPLPVAGQAETLIRFSA